MKLIRSLFLSLLVAGPAFAGAVIDVMVVDGVKLEAVKFGPVNDGKIVLFHSHGITTVPVSSLPAEYQGQFASKTAAATPAPKTENSFLPVPREVPENKPAPQPLIVREPIAKQVPPANSPTILEAMRAKRIEPVVNSGKNDWAEYNHDRVNRLLLDGKLVEKYSLTPLVGFLAKEKASISEEGRTYNGAALDIAERKNNTDHVANAMELRPSLWRRSDERVFLINYKPSTLPGVLMQLYVVEIDQVAGWRTFKVATEPGFEEWKRLAR